MDWHHCVVPVIVLVRDHFCIDFINGNGFNRFFIFSSMNISAPCVVELTWTLTDTLNEELDVLSEPIEFFVGGHDLLGKIEEALMGHEVGDELALHLEPEEAFGDYDEHKVFLESRDLFPKETEEGMTFDGSTLPKKMSSQAPVELIYTVTDLYPEHVVLDGNHPLAGIALRLLLKIHAIREASEDEIAQGSMGIGFFQPVAHDNEAFDADDDDMEEGASQAPRQSQPPFLH